MRAVAFTLISFIYIFSVSVWLVDATILIHTEFTPVSLDGTPIDSHDLVNDAEGFRQLSEETLNPSQDGNILDRITQYFETGYASVWVVLDLLSGTYAFNILSTIGVPPAFVLALKFIFPMLVASQVIWYVAGRY